MDPLLEAVLRKDKKKAGRREVESFLAQRSAERRAKLAETTGALDALTLLPGAAALKAARGGSFGNAAVNALAFTSQFGDDPASRAGSDLAAYLPMAMGMKGLSRLDRATEFLKRSTANTAMTGAGMAGARALGLDLGDGGTAGESQAAIPVFEGVGSLGNLRRVAKRAMEKGKDLPQFDWEGKIAPRRQQELEQRMRAWIPKLSSKDPAAAATKLDEWVKNNPFWGKYPLEKGPLLDLMPAELRQPFYQSLKEMGYGGTRMGDRTALGSRGEKLGGRARNANFGEIKPFADRKWEDILKFEQGGGLPAGWAAENPGRKPSWVARPGEKLAPDQENFLESLTKAAGGGSLGAGILGGLALGDEENTSDDLAAVSSQKKVLRRLLMAQNPRFLEPLSNEKVAGAVKFNKSPQKDPLVWGAQRFENLADILPGRQQRRGMYYTLAEPRPTGQTWEPRGMYQHSFSDLLKPGSEGGSRGVLGDVIVRNPLLLPHNSFFGNYAPQIIGGDPNKFRNFMRRGVASDIRGANSWEALNKALPKKYRLNNTDIRNFKNDPNRAYSFNDTVGDLLLSKFLKNEGYDAGIPRGVRKSISKFGPANVHQSEVVFPAESRWDLRPQFQPNWKTIESWAKGDKVLPPEVELNLLKRGVPVNGPEVSDLQKASYIIEKTGLSITPDQYLKNFKTTNTPYSFLTDQYNSIVNTYGPPKPASKLDSFAKQLGVKIPQAPIAPATASWISPPEASWDDVIVDHYFDKIKAATKPKMTKADRIAKWGNPGFKEPTFGKVLFTLDDFLQYRLPNKSAVGKKSPSGTFTQDYFAPVQQINDVGGPQFFSIETTPPQALYLGQKGAKPFGGTYHPPSNQPITLDEIEELKKLFKVHIPMHAK